jgi:hypothetical protein
MENKYFTSGNYQAKSDHEPGYIYLMEAEGYHGIIPGCYLRRCKIGLSRNPQLRLQNFHSNQPPCNIKILTTIYVEDMAEIEGQLHQQFKNSQVKDLIKSREWFDLNPVDLALVHWAFSRYSVRVDADRISTAGLIAACLVALVGVGTIGSMIMNQPAMVEPEVNNVR